MNKYIAYYNECTYEGAWEYVIPFESNLSINELNNLVIEVAYKNKDIGTVITGLPHYLNKEEILRVEIYTLEDWFNLNKVVV